MDRGDEILARLPKLDADCVEVGVWRGELSHYLLSKHDRLMLYMVDRWASVPEGHSYRKSGSQCANCTQEAFDQAFVDARVSVMPFVPRATICYGESVYWANTLKYCLFDGVFLDGDHTYRGVSSDIEAWWLRVRIGGWIGGHDWDHPIDKWDVRGAVEKHCSETGETVELGRDRTWFVTRHG